MKNLYKNPNPDVWSGRTSEAHLYLHEKIQFLNLNETTEAKFSTRYPAILGYASDEGVRRNQGRIGAKDAPNAIRKNLAKYANHLKSNELLFDAGDVFCPAQNLEEAHQEIEKKIFKLLNLNFFPVVLGGGHDLAYPHYRAIRSYVSDHQKIGIINLDAHFDLRKKTDQANSGTPFYQIATESAPDDFNYLCLGIQQQANTALLFQTAEKFGVQYITNDEYTLLNWEAVYQKIQRFIVSVDHIYLTIDLDGFASAMGVSAVSPFGFSWQIAHQTLKLIKGSGKLISADIVELNPTYDVAQFTAKLGAGMAYYLME